MVRSLYSAASGMMAQQTNVDVIANNLANVNTIGYKSQSAEFKSLLYQDLQAKTTSANGENKPVTFPSIFSIAKNPIPFIRKSVVPSVAFAEPCV